jgi:phosphoglycolate phosphatase-like HAD superfamily hydrolase
MTKYLIFDFDGVLADSDSANLEHMVQHEHFAPKTIEEARSHRLSYFAKPPDFHSESQIPEQNYKLDKAFGDHYIKSGVQLFHDFVEELKKIEDVKLAIVSSAAEHYIKETLKQTDLKFDLVFGIETSPSKQTKVKMVCDQWGIKPEQAFYITDTKADVIELQDLMTVERIIGCHWGWHGYEVLREVLPSDQILEEYFEIHRAIGNDNYKAEARYDKNIEKKIKKQQEYEERVKRRAKEEATKEQMLKDFIETQQGQKDDSNILGHDSFKVFEDDKRTLDDLTGGAEEEGFQDWNEEVPYDNGYEIQTTNVIMDKEYTLLDSTGIRRPGQRTFGAESFATFRTIEEAYRADVICMVVDGSEPLAHQDQVVAGILKEAGKGVVVLVNKADLVPEEDRVNFQSNFEHKFAFLKIKKFIWVSAKTLQGINHIWDNIDLALEERSMDISREELRRLFNFLMKRKPPKKLRLEKRPVVYDLLYHNTSTPTFELLVKNKQTIHWSYLRFLENTVRANFGFQNTEIKVKAVNVARKQVVT